MSEPLAFRNGRFVAPADLTLAPHDAGFVFGATVTDFCRTYHRRLFRWPDHLARLRRDCETCRIPLLYSDAELTAAAEQLVAHNARLLATDDDLALVTFATPGPLGHLSGSPENGPPTLGMHTTPIRRERYQRFFTEGVTLAVAGTYAPVAAAAKHRSRLPWWLAQQEVEPGAVPALLDASGVADTPIGAVLAVKGETVLRPPVGAALDSISVKVIGELSERVGLRFAEAAFDVRRDGGELLLAGSAFGVAGVRRVTGPTGERTLAWPGPVLQRLTAAWSAEVGCAIW